MCSCVRGVCVGVGKSVVVCVVVVVVAGEEGVKEEVEDGKKLARRYGLCCSRTASVLVKR